MLVREVIMQAAQVLGIEKGILSYLDGDDEIYEKDLKQLLGCFHGVECSLALNYLPLYAEDTLHTTTGRIEYESLRYSPVLIISVTDEQGNPVPYTLYPTYIKLKAGTWKVTYTYTPMEKGVGEECDFTLLVSDRMLVYGVLAEYCLAEGRYEDAAEWDKKYKAEIESIFRKRTCQRISSRRWV